MRDVFFWKVIFVMTTLIEWVAFKMIADASDEYRYPKVAYRIGWWSVVFIEVAMNLSNWDVNLKVIGLILITYIFYKVYYQSSYLKSIIVVGVFWLISIGSDGLTMGIMSWFTQAHSPFALLEIDVTRISMIILSKSLLIGIVLIYRQFAISFKDNQREINYIILPILTNIIIILFIFGYLPQMGLNMKDYYGLILGIAILIFLANFSLITIIVKFTKEYKEKMELKNYHDRVKADYAYYTLLEKEHEQVRRCYHDIKNHMACIKGLMQDELQLNDYIEGLEEELQSLQQTFHTGNKVVDTIFKQKSVLCAEHQIDLKVALDLNACNSLEEKDLCSIFANAIDNAIESCKKIEHSKGDRYINVEQQIIHQFLVIKITNAKMNPIVEQESNLLTNKKDVLLHGYGLKNIKRCVSKYDGEVVIKYSDEAFCLKIVIPLV